MRMPPKSRRRRASALTVFTLTTVVLARFYRWSLILTNRRTVPKNGIPQQHPIEYDGNPCW